MCRPGKNALTGVQLFDKCVTAVQLCSSMSVTDVELLHKYMASVQLWHKSMTAVLLCTLYKYVHDCCAALYIVQVCT
jgi:hypothetical protein